METGGGGIEHRIFLMSGVKQRTSNQTTQEYFHHHQYLILIPYSEAIDGWRNRIQLIAVFLGWMRGRMKKQKHNLTDLPMRSHCCSLLSCISWRVVFHGLYICYSELMNRNCFLWIEGNDTSSVEIGMILKKVSYLSLVQCRGHSVWGWPELNMTIWDNK